MRENAKGDAYAEAEMEKKMTTVASSERPQRKRKCFRRDKRLRTDKDSSCREVDKLTWNGIMH